MKKSRLLIIMTLFLLPISLAQTELDFAQTAEMELSAESSLLLTNPGGSFLVDYLIANLTFFPINTELQDILSLDVNSNPISQITKTPNSIQFRWDNIDTTQLFFNFISKVKTKNQLPQIDKKIKFPLNPNNLPEDVITYTTPSQYINENADIIQKASELSEGEDDLYQVVHNVAEWVNHEIKYDLNTETANQVLDSVWVMKNRKGVCDEIANLFISMIRSLGVPARFVSGVVYSNIDAGFGNHGWAEVYFPDYGWVPVDPTFGEFGYIDPGHIKFKESLDSGEPALYFKWRSTGVDLTAERLDISTKLLNYSGSIGQTVNINVEPYYPEVDFGSYVPLKISLENTEKYYVPLTIYIIKAPTLLDDKNYKHVLLKPLEKKTIYFISKLSDELNDQFIYKSNIVVNTSRGASAISEITFAEQYEFISLEEADSVVKTNEIRSTKKQFPDLNLNCQSKKTSYYENESITIICNVNNNGTSTYDSLSVCLDQQCQNLALHPNQTNQLRFTANPKTNLAINLESEDYFKEDLIAVRLVHYPDVKMIQFKGDSVNYDASGQIKFKIFADMNSKNVKVYLKNNNKIILVGDLPITQRLNEEEFVIDFTGKEFANGKISIIVDYEDLLNKPYSKEYEYNVQITNVPTLVKIKLWVIKLF